MERESIGHSSPQKGGTTASRSDLQASDIAPDITKYLDFREYLADFYEFKRVTNTSLRPYSYSVFSAAADIKSPNYLKLIIEGKRNLSNEMIQKFTKALQLSKTQAQEFFHLVKYAQEGDPLKRNQILRELAELRVDQKIRNGEMDAKEWKQIPSWVAWVLYAMSDQAGVLFELDHLKDLLRGRAREDEIRKALDQLIESGQLMRDEEGRIVKGTGNAANEKISVALVRKLQAELNYLGMESLFEDSAKEREFGALTLALTKEEFEQYRFELRQLRKRIHKEIAVKRQTGSGERIYQLNLQLFPVTKSVTESVRNEDFVENSVESGEKS